MSEEKNILPLHLLKFSEKKNAMVELKSGETYNGILDSVDKFMNIKMENAVLSDKNAQVFHSVKEAYIRGNTIKYFTIDSDVLANIQKTEYVCPEKWKKTDIKEHKNKSKKKV